MLTLTPRIGLVGNTARIDQAAVLLHAHDYEPVRFTTPATFIDDLLVRYPVLVIVDSASAAWEFFVTTCKTEQATRRLPVIVIAEDKAQVSAALNAGADMVLPADTLDANLIDTIRRHALILDPETLELLRCQCAEELPDLARQGVEKFNKGAFYAQHDAFEDQWMHEAGPVRELYRAVLQVGVAYYHITRGNYAGGLKMLRRVEQWFARLPDQCQGIDLHQLRADASAVRAALAAMDPSDIDSFDRALLKPVPLVDSARPE